MHRLGDLDRLTESLRAQQHSHTEAVVCFNNCDAAAGRERFSRLARDLRIPVSVLDCGNVPLGRVMNLGMERARGEILCKIDADNIYFPEFCERILAYHSHFAADLTSQADGFPLFEEQDRSPSAPVIRETTVPLAGATGGGAISVRRHVWDKVRWEDDLRRGEDTSFFHRCRALGYSSATCDPFGYVSVRGRNENHSHKIPALRLVNRAVYILGDRGCLWMASLQSSTRRPVAHGLGDELWAVV